MTDLIRRLLQIRIIRFANVGALATLVHALTFYILNSLLYMDSQQANFCGFGLAAVFSYLGQRHYTFRGTTDNSQLWSVRLRFAVSALTGYAENAFWVFLTDHVLKLPSQYALAGILFLTPLTMFLIMRYWVFREKPDTSLTD